MPKPSTLDSRVSPRPLPAAPGGLSDSSGARSDTSGAVGWLTDLLAIGAIVALLAVAVSLIG